ncbi:PREDICTED: uncharacterized protein LOC109158846 [Ipomoea nil]|uniref:uncharacterized protein LOC109158846 n=1 Tax=Ipomoea nil TaxID=35883 RepID=UPI000900FD46|nr:PREDICTED: uncharacterized protein LOC109158846 [Ipomoea nil]
MTLFNMKVSYAAFVLYLLASQAVLFDKANAAGCGQGGCGNIPAASLEPCLGAAKDARAKVPPTCCGKVGALLKTAPKCLCVVLLSPLAMKVGVNPAIAVTIPKRCIIKNRPVGKKCGRYTIP